MANYPAASNWLSPLCPVQVQNHPSRQQNPDLRRWRDNAPTQRTRLDVNHLDLHQLADQRSRPIGEYGLHMRRPSDKLALAPAGLLEQNIKALAHTGPIESLSLILDEVLKRSEAPSFRRFVNLAGHFGGGRPRSGRIFKGVGRREAHRSNESERLVEIGVGFAGITDDEVGGEGDVRARSAHARHNVEIVGDTVAAVHRL